MRMCGLGIDCAEKLLYLVNFVVLFTLMNDLVIIYVN